MNACRDKGTGGGKSALVRVRIWTHFLCHQLREGGGAKLTRFVSVYILSSEERKICGFDAVNEAPCSHAR